MEDITIKAEIDVVITQEDIDDIMVSALEGGINYRCSKADVVGEYLGKYGSEQISRGGKMILHDREKGKEYELDREKFLNGIKKYLEDKDRPYDILCENMNSVGCSRGAYKLDCGMVDAVVADMIIQFAVMGDVVYG